MVADVPESILSKTLNKVLLIMDNCGPHGTDLVDPHDQVKVVFLPPNCTSVFQPMVLWSDCNAEEKLQIQATPQNVQHL